MVLHVEDHRDSSSCRSSGGRCPCYALIAGSTGAHGPASAVAPLLVPHLAFRAVYTGTRPGLPPPSGRGRGGGDAGSLLPGVLPPN